jgi:4-hydroxy-tetrahydrodipicolinate synthase
MTLRAALNAMFPHLRIFVGSDHLFLNNLKAGGAGCITAACNLLAPLAARVYGAFQAGENAQPAQDLFSAARSVIDRYPPSAASLKGVLALRYDAPGWDVLPPLLPVSLQDRNALLEALVGLALADRLPWLREAVARANLTTINTAIPL